METRRQALAGVGLAIGAGLLWMRPTPGTKQTPAGSAGLPDTPLLTHDGERVRFYHDLVRGRTVAINMMYTRCVDRCPMATHHLARVHQLLGARAGRDVFMYSISLKPEEDSPAALRAFMRDHGVVEPWTFLTGAPADILALRYALGFRDIDAAVDADLASHTGMVRIGSEPRDRWTSAASLSAPEQIFATINHVDPVMRHTFNGVPRAVAADAS